MSDVLPPSALINSLNRYFDCVILPTRRRDNVWETMGDGFLAIFNENSERREACDRLTVKSNIDFKSLARAKWFESWRARGRTKAETTNLCGARCDLHPVGGSPLQRAAISVGSPGLRGKGQRFSWVALPDPRRADRSCFCRRQRSVRQMCYASLSRAPRLRRSGLRPLDRSQSPHSGDRHKCPAWTR
jgi:class 3 adenylate cyclase